MVEKLKEGEMYLTVSILGTIKLAAFKNDKKDKPTDPDYVGNGIAIWKNTKRAANKSPDDS